MIYLGFNALTMIYRKWCTSSIAKLVQITPISLGLMVDISLVDGVINHAYNWGVPHCRYLMTNLKGF